MCTGLTFCQARPRRPAAYGRFQGFDHHALVAGVQRLLEHRRGFVRAGTERARHPVLARGPVEGGEPHVQRLVDQVVPVEVQAVEEEGPEKQLVHVRAEAARGLLERARAAVVVQCEGLAVEHDAAARQAPHQLHQLGDALGHLLERARPHPHDVAVAVHLDAGTVQLELDGHLGAQLRKRRLQALGRARQHRPDGAADGRHDGIEGGGAPDEGRTGRLGQPSGEHERSAHGGRGHVGGRRDRLQHHAFQRALAQLPGEQAPEEPLLVLRGRTEQGGELLGAPRG